MRQPKPWFRKQTRSWYVQIGKKQINLGRNTREAWQEYYRLMAETQSDQQPSNLTVHSILESFLGWGDQNLAIATTQKNRFHLARFKSYLANSVSVQELKPQHVQDWIDRDYRGRSNTYKHTAITVIQGAINWSVEQGLIEHNPIDRLRKPARNIREFFVPTKDWPRLVELCRNDGFREIVVFMLSTGARPQEARRIEGRHLDLENHRVVFPIAESKGKRRHRVIYLDAVSCS